MTKPAINPRYQAYTPGYEIVVTDLERDVVISLLETALSGWEGNQDRQDAAQRVINKLKLG